MTPRKPAWSELFPGTRKGQPQLRRDADWAWHQIVPSLEQAGLLAFVDAFILIEACTVWARIRQIERAITEQGLLVAADRDHEDRGFVRHPLATVANQYRAQLRFLIAELGLSPSARGRLDVGPLNPVTQGRRVAGDEDLLD